MLISCNIKLVETLIKLWQYAPVSFIFIFKHNTVLYVDFKGNMNIVAFKHHSFPPLKCMSLRHFTRLCYIFYKTAMTCK